MLFSFCWKGADYVRAYGYIWYFFSELVYHIFKLLCFIIPVHQFQYLIIAALHRYMQEFEYFFIFINFNYLIQNRQYIAWVHHAYPDKKFFIYFYYLVQQSRQFILFVLHSISSIILACYPYLL